MQHQQHVFVGGEWAQPHGTERLDVHSPATEAVIGSVPLAARPDVDRAVAAARQAFDGGGWADLDPGQRLAYVNRFAAAVTARSAGFVDVLSAEVGLPRASLPAGQIAKAEGVFTAYAQLAAEYPWSETRTGSRGRTLRVHRRPVGVVAALVPWNAPLFIAALKLAPALLAGATVVLKPSEEAPLHASLLAECAVEAGLPAGVFNVLVALPEVSEYLVTHPGVDKVSFTGSTAVGRRIGELCGHDIRRCTLELGGKSAALLLDDFEPTEANARSLATGAMANSGQVCAAQTRILAPRQRYGEVVEAVAAAVEGLRVGDPQDAGTNVGPLVSARQRERVEGHLARGRSEGARVVVGGGRPAAERGWYVQPTLFDRVEPQMALAREEIFGPVAAVLPYDDEEHAIALANDSSYGLAGAVWTSDAERGEAVAGRFRSGSVAVNSPAPLDPHGPFGGFKQSGIGREGGPEGLTAYTEYQTIVLPG
ncbi:aldehyde dehydrogenase [Streptomyces sulphureus]|uniref:aldehyde dehydrogenase n=1 Tax=Streptomyces sulphureus TaxID=47758 RepID=UPI00036E3443|nr:aldehyde dehydrogenase [Streptomyces sulphureus]